MVYHLCCGKRTASLKTSNKFIRCFHQFCPKLFFKLKRNKKKIVKTNSQIRNLKLVKLSQNKIQSQISLPSLDRGRILLSCWSDTFIDFSSRFHSGPEVFDPREIWIPKNLTIKKFGLCTKMNDFLAGTKFLGIHNSWGLNISGTKKLRESNEIEDHFRTSRYLKDSLVSEKYIIFDD